MLNKEPVGTGLPIMEIYRVGGYVRDRLMGLTPTDCDYVVVGSSATEMLNLGYTQVGNYFPVFLHPITKEEYALARTERKHGQGHRGFLVNSSSKVTLEEDLARRDLTINAIAMDLAGNLIDPYNGVADIQSRILRHVSTAFRDDPLRILRAARFAAKFNFSVAAETLDLLKEMAKTKEGNSLSKERIFTELNKALATDFPARFFEILRFTHNLELFFPSLSQALNDDDTFCRFKTELNNFKSKYSRYTVLAIYLTGYPTANQELSNTKSIQNYIYLTQLLDDGANCLPTDEDILLLIKKTNAIKNPSLFNHIYKNYSKWLQYRKLNIAQTNLSFIQKCIESLQSLPIQDLIQTNPNPPDLAKAIMTRQLSSIQKLRKSI